MIRALLVFVLLLGSGWLGIQLSKDPGYLLVAINHWTVETTLVVALFGLVLLFLVVFLLFKLISKIIYFPSRLQNWLNRRRIKKARSTTRKGLIEYSEGYWQKAKKHLIKALPNSDAPLINYLTAARAAQKMGDNGLRDHYLREAQQSMPEAKIAVELTQAELQIANQQWEQALATLKHLKDLAPHHPYVLKLLSNLYEEVKDWPQLIALLPELKKHQILSPGDYEALKCRAYLHLIREKIRHHQTDTLKDLMNHLPKSLYYHPDLNAEYCRFLLQENEHELAEKILRRCLKKVIHEPLIRLYGFCKYNIDSQLNFAENLVKRAPHSPTLFLCLGRLSIADKLWGKAKTYLEKSIDLRPQAESYAELGKLYDQLNEPFKACESYRKGLDLVIDSPQK